ncbi:MAG: sigma-70 family RNA polymerase sigma factor [Proteobacteria bacterium]|nr:sigma-70 family RNA polymerase sigma factor [Pseudomonadota bacterium]
MDMHHRRRHRARWDRHEDAEDAAQEAFLSAYCNVGRMRGANVRSWLLRIASNQSYDILRASKRRPAQSLDESLENPNFQVRSDAETPEQAAVRNELGDEIQRAIMTLPEDQRTVLVLIDVQGLSYDEAAQAAGASMGTVKSRLSRARSRIRDHLRQRRELLPDEYRQ